MFFHHPSTRFTCSGQAEENEDTEKTLVFGKSVIAIKAMVFHHGENLRKSEKCCLGSDLISSGFFAQN